jgi:eukaryotic-like serine/threonine-protein kinase
MNATHPGAARRYRIERYLTEGGMGAIYLGKKLGPVGFEKEVVLKQLLPEYTARPEFRDLFFREAKISATLDHANIVHTFDLVESDESLFIVMEYVRGVDLRTIVRRARLRRKELAPAAAIHVALDVLAGLAYAHARRDANGASMSIIHRDVSPSNILCSAEGEAKLSDFGIAKASTHSSVFYRVRGKVGYMSPEQARNEPIDHRSDLYSLGVCLYESLTAERLFVGDLSTPPDVIYGQPVMPPSKKRPSLPSALDEVLVKALAPKPEDRYQTAIAFTEALRQVAHRCGLSYSAPQLAQHLRETLGPDPSRWLQDDGATSTSGEGTQKIPMKDLEGKEAASIGLDEGSNLDEMAGKDEEPTRRVPYPKDDSPAGVSKASRAPRDFIPVREDDEEIPTVARDKSALAPPPPMAIPKRTNSTAPYPLAPSMFGAKRPSIPPPPPAAALAPPAPPLSALIPRASSANMAAATGTVPPPPVNFGAQTLTVPPPPPKPATRGYGDSPFADSIGSDIRTPLPPPTSYDIAAPTPPPVSPLTPGPPPGRPVVQSLRNSWPPNPAPLQLAPPETIDFAEGTVPIAVPRSGPPGLLVLIVLLGAAAGGAKLGHLVTRGDVAALEASTAAARPSSIK